jgi:hypothetical protein
MRDSLGGFTPMADQELTAARLALLAARAAVSRKLQIRSPVLRLHSSRERLTLDAMVQRLVAAPKPLLCRAREAGGCIELAYLPLLPGTPEFEDHTRGIESDRRDGGFMGYLAKASPSSEEPTVYCVGREESLTAPLTVLDIWHRDYYQSKYVGWRGDSVTNPLRSQWPEYVQAQRLNASGVLIFLSPEDHPVKMYMIMKDDM